MFCRIRDARPQITNVAKERPRVMSNEIRKLKAKQLEEDRQIVIETENRRLLERISSIIKRKRKDSKFSDTSSVISGHSSTSSQKSLNKGFRK